MKKFMILLAALVPLALVSGCNKPKPVKLDYTEKMEQGLWDPQGLPGESHIGAPPEDFKHSGYNPSEGGEDPNEQGDTSGRDSAEKPKDTSDKHADSPEKTEEDDGDETD